LGARLPDTRLACYQATGNALAEKAKRDVDVFAGFEQVRFTAGLEKK
jgi:hypothetical protein